MRRTGDYSTTAGLNLLLVGLQVSENAMFSSLFTAFRVVKLQKTDSCRMFAHVNFVFLISKQYSVTTVGLERKTNSHWHAT
jgi:hypothetical protein